MALENDAMLSPQQAALEHNKKQLQVESLLGTIYTEASNIAKSEASGPQILPGTGGKTAGMLMQEQQATLQAQATAQKIAADTDWVNLASVLGQDIASLAKQQRAITDKIVKDSSVSFFDDPLTAIANAFTLPWDEQALEGINTKLQATTQAANAAHSHVQQSAATADRIKSTVTQATLAEQATALEKLQSTIAAQARIDAAKTGADAIKQSMQMDKESLNIYVQNVQLRNSEEHMKMARAAEARQIEMYNLQLSKVQDEKAADAERLRLINRALEEEGKNPLDVKKFNNWKATSADMLDMLLRKGMQLEISGKDNYSYGATIEDRYKYMNTIGWQPKTKQQDTIIALQEDAKKKVDPRITDKKAVAAAANSDFQATFKNLQNDIREGNPFAAPAFSVYAGTPISNNPIWKEYVAPSLTEESAKNPVTPEFIRGVVTKAVVDRKVTSAQAAEFAKQIFDQAIAINNTTHQFRKIAGQEQETYGVRMNMGADPRQLMRSGILFVASGGKTAPPVGSFFGNTKDFKANDKVQWEALIARDIATQVVKAKIKEEIPDISKTAGYIREDAATFGSKK